MATATKRKFISGVSIICAVMLIVGIFPIVTNDSKVEATDTGEYFYTPAKLYDYYYDTDNGKSFDFGNTSKDYAKYRDIYPKEFYRHILDLGLCKDGQKGQTFLPIFICERLEDK